jgi:3-(3-hydroxy-phenyl)propionate hydroxylase/6-hydroxy-3-succinoylpyridine 3-monooxygenase
MLSEADPAQRKADKEAMYAEADKGGANVRASSLAQLMKGAPLPLEPLGAVTH